MAFNVGVNVLEVDGSASPTIVAAPISVGAYLVRSERGIPNHPVHLLGLTDYVSNFGGHGAGMQSSHAVAGFFQNGGTEAYAVRVVGAGHRPASEMLADSGPADTLLVEAGNKGRADPGEWGNSLSVQIDSTALGTSGVPAQIISANTELFTLASGNQLSVNVDGATAAETITFNAGADFTDITQATAAEIAAVINRESTSVTANVTDDLRVLIASRETGPASHLAVAGSAAAPLGFVGATANSDAALAATTTVARMESIAGFTADSALLIETAAHNVAAADVAATMPVGATMTVDVTEPGGGPVRTSTIAFVDTDFVGPVVGPNLTITAPEVVVAINRQADGFRAELNNLGRVVLLSDAYGAGTTIALTAGGVDALPSLGLTAAPVAGTTQPRAAASVSDRNRLLSWSGALPGTPAFAARIRTAEFDLTVYRNGEEVERFENLSMQNNHARYVDNIINDQDAGSRFVRVADQGSATGVSLDVPASGRFPLGVAVGRDGQDGSTPSDNNYIGRSDVHTGLYAFDTVGVQLLATPDTTSLAVTGAALAYCEQRGDAMFIGTAPRGYDRDAIKTYANGLRARKVYGAVYAPWIKITNPADISGTDPFLWVTPVGHVMGTFARIADAKGVWQAPAGSDARLRFALDTEFEMNDAEHTDLVKAGGVNGIRPIAGEGIVIDASRTLSTDTRWLFVNVRRLFNFVKSSLRDGLRWVPQEAHDQELRDKVRLNSVRPFLLGLWRRGAFGSEPAEMTFTIKCDGENNPPAEVNVGRFTIEIYFYAVRPAETIVIKVGQQDSSGTATDS